MKKKILRVLVGIPLFAIIYIFTASVAYLIATAINMENWPCGASLMGIIMIIILFFSIRLAIVLSKKIAYKEKKNDTV